MSTFEVFISCDLAEPYLICDQEQTVMCAGKAKPLQTRNSE